MLNILVVTANFRNLDNILPLVELVRTKGGTVKIWAVVNDQDPSVSLFAEKDVTLSYMEKIPPTGTISDAFKRAFTQEHVASNFDFCILTDVQTPLAKSQFQFFQKQGVTVIGQQHGVLQRWDYIRNNQNFDHLFVFGEQFRRHFEPKDLGRIVPAGLPKLDKLPTFSATGGHSILFIAQQEPRADIVLPLLSGLERALDMRVVIRPHPQFPDVYRNGSIEVSASPNLQAQVEAASFVITTHSTAVLEALYMNRPVVLLPNYGLTEFGDYPGIAKDFTVAEVESALGRCLSKDMEFFLQKMVGGIHYHHSEIYFDHLVRMKEGTLWKVPAPRTRAFKKNWRLLARLGLRKWLKKKSLRHLGSTVPLSSPRIVS